MSAVKISLCIVDVLWNVLAVPQPSVDLQWVFFIILSFDCSKLRVRINCIHSILMNCVCTKTCSVTDVVLVLPSVKVKHFDLFIMLRFLIEQKPYCGLHNGE